MNIIILFYNNLLPLFPSRSSFFGVFEFTSCPNIAQTSHSMPSKTGNRKILLICRRYMPRPPTSILNTLGLFPYHQNLNLVPSSQIESPIPDHNLPSCSYCYVHCARSGYPLRRLLPIDSPSKVPFLQFFRTSTRSFCRKPCLQRSPDRPSSMKWLSRRTSISFKLGLEPEKLAEIVEEISSDTDRMEMNLDKFDFTPSTVVQVLCTLNDGGHSARRFMNWVLNYHPGFKSNSEIFNLIVDNLGRIEDFSSMYNMLSELSSKGHCLTENAFSFVKFCSSSTIKDSVRRVTEVLNGISGSCRGSGIYSLIKLLCAINSFDLAFYVMEETVRKTSYYNLLIAAKCSNGNFSEALHIFDEMKKHACDPNTKSYNYLLGSLFKHNKFVGACQLLQKMDEASSVPDLVTYEVLAIHACKANRMDYAVEILNFMLSEGLKPRPTTHATFIKGYFLAGRVENAYNYVTEMSVKDKCSNNLNYSLLASLFHLTGRVVEAGIILHEMMQKGLKPNFPVYIKVLKGLHKIARGDLASELKSMFLKFNSSIDAG